MMRSGWMAERDIAPSDRFGSGAIGRSIQKGRHYVFRKQDNYLAEIYEPKTEVMGRKEGTSKAIVYNISVYLIVPNSFRDEAIAHLVAKDFYAILQGPKTTAYDRPQIRKDSAD